MAPIHELVAGSTLVQLQATMDEGTLSSASLTTYFTERIERLDPILHAVIALDPGALALARELDEERSHSGARSWLHGIPLLIKDNIETRDPLATTCGSLALADNRVGRDAPIVEALREAGAVILGKANLSEWANFRSVRSTSGWSAIGGQARNPYDTSRSPCGSSSGSAIAVAASLAVAAVGTETNGSVICPASLNGVVGFKPAVGELPQAGIVPISHSQDTAGPMTRSVVDAAILAACMGGRDDRALVKRLSEGTPGSLVGGRRLGVVGGEALDPDVAGLLSHAVDALRATDVEIVEGLAFETPSGFHRACFEVLLFEFKHDLNAYLRTLPGELASMQLRDLIAFNAARPAEEMPHFAQEIFELAESRGDLDDVSYREALALARKTTRGRGIDALMRSQRLDALISPSSVPAWPIDPTEGDPRVGGSAMHPAVAGYPNISVPMGYARGLPVGLSFYARPEDRESLLEIARGYELVAPPRCWPDL